VCEAEVRVMGREGGRVRALHDYHASCRAVEENGRRLAWVKGRTFLWGVEDGREGGREGGGGLRTTGEREGGRGTGVAAGLGVEGGEGGGGKGGGRRGRPVFDDW
jgi:hypothetical protein